MAIVTAVGLTEQMRPSPPVGRRWSSMESTLLRVNEPTIIRLLTLFNVPAALTPPSIPRGRRGMSEDAWLGLALIWAHVGYFWWIIYQVTA